MKKTYLFLALLSLFFIKISAGTIYFVSPCAFNAGDYYSCPDLYYDFKNYQTIKIELQEFKNNEKNNQTKLKDAIIIFGGGGILDTTKPLSSLYNNMDLSNKCFHWGSGSNRLNVNEIDWELSANFIDIKKDVLKHFILVGRRDYLDNYYKNHVYVPCVSCKLPYLKQKYEIKRRIGIVNHAWLKLINKPQFPQINMNLKKYTIEEIIRFIGESEVIITSSFHGAYWGLLLNKKVIINGNWSSKFDTLKYPLVLLSDNLEKDIQNCVVPPADYLNECIDLNNAFYEKIMKLIEQY
ncbi:MAG: polysaccharide pyruvyl transferase family protein [Simkaniaceae bacterium]|nr:polysaccharide pyruvyl transferase family protein [Simkaniaceae bacterium]